MPPLRKTVLSAKRAATAPEPDPPRQRRGSTGITEGDGTLCGLQPQGAQRTGSTSRRVGSVDVAINQVRSGEEASSTGTAEVERVPLGLALRRRAGNTRATGQRCHRRRGRHRGAPGGRGPYPSGGPTRTVEAQKPQQESIAGEEAEAGFPGEEVTSTSIASQVATPHFAVEEAETGIPGEEGASSSITGEVSTLTVAAEVTPTSVTDQATTSAVTGEEAAPSGITSKGTCTDTRAGEEAQSSSFAATGHTSPESLGIAETSKSGQAKEPLTVACSPAKEPSCLAHPGSCLLYTSPSPRD